MTMDLASRIRRHLHVLAVEIGQRATGSASNRRAQRYIADVFLESGLEVEQQAFDCLDWQHVATHLLIGGQSFPAMANPFSPPCHVTAPMVTAGSLAELEACSLKDSIALLHGALTTEPLMPKNFPFLTVEDHQRIIRLLEIGQPKAIITVHPRAPVIEDGDFLLPSATVPAETGAQLLARLNEPATLQIESLRRDSRGANVIARSPIKAERKVVICAHFDTKQDTPGALDNAGGVAVLLALAQTVPASRFELEFIAFNGEDYYSSPGQVAYIRQHAAEFGRIALAINIDGVGLKHSGNTIAYFECPETLIAAIEQLRRGQAALARAEPWPQGDHSLFWPQGVPSVAFTSQGIEALIDTVVHTPDDTVDRVSPESIARIVDFIRQIPNALSVGDTPM